MNDIVVGPPGFGIKDVIVFSADRTRIAAEMRSKFPRKIDDDNNLTIDKTPTKRNGIKSLSLLRVVSQKDLDDLGTITAWEILGTYEEMFRDPIKEGKYDSVYDRTPREVIIDGKPVTITPPDKIGEFFG
jgi:hypothetical protein